MKVTVRKGRHRFFWLDFALPLLILAVLTPMFHIFDWDIRLQRIFWTSGAGWIAGEGWLFQALYRFGNIPALLISLFAAFVLIRGFSSERFERYRKMAVYLLLVMALGPGLIVNTLLKDQWGRPRPRDLTEFGGKYRYEAPLEIDPASPGKSFPCGHATMGYFFFAPALLLRPRKKLYGLLTGIGAVVFGTLIGIARMAQGGHFASDVIWAGILVWLVAAGLYYVLRLDTRPFSNTLKRRAKKLGAVWKALIWLVAVGLIIGVGLATPHKSRRSYHWDDRPDVNIVRVAAQYGDLNIGFGERSSLRSVSSGFGFPGSRVKWKRYFTAVDSLQLVNLTQSKSGMFTELNAVADLSINPLAIKGLEVVVSNGDIILDAKEQMILPGFDLGVKDGNIELILPKTLRLRIAARNPLTIQNGHPGVEIVAADAITPYRISMPRGNLVIRMSDK